ncbi:MAG: hypothetical protein IPM57_10490 [Oligoflexia bacterium]|nr:hypothetical protein [Oligoflexia bacterium]
MFFNRGYKLLLIVLISALAACKNSNSNSKAVINPINYCTTPECYGASGNTTFSGGGVATLNVVSTTVLSQYAGRYVNPTTPVEINIKVAPADNNVFLGELNIRYSEGSVVRMGHFTNGTETNTGNNVHILTTDSATGVPTYRFFFEDPAGVIIVTLQNTGGGLPSDTTFNSGTLDGIVYFRNFNSTAPNPLYQGYQDNFGYYWPANPKAFCWSGQINTGPYDCKNFSVQPSTTTNNPVTKLGTFTGMDKKLALGL